MAAGMMPDRIGVMAVRDCGELRDVLNKGIEMEIAERMRQILMNLLHDLYGEHPDARVCRRWEEEEAAVFGRHGMELRGAFRDRILALASLYELSQWFRERRIPYWLHGAAGSSFFLYLLGITSADPLPPHYRCPVCGHTEWFPRAAVSRSDCRSDGFDGSVHSNDHICPSCRSAQMIPDGHDLPWQMCWGSGDNQIGDSWRRVSGSGIGFEIATVTEVFPELREKAAHHWLHRFYPAEHFQKKHCESVRVADLPNLAIVCCYDSGKLEPAFFERKAGAQEWQAFLSEQDAWRRLPKNPRTETLFAKEGAFIPKVTSFADLVSFEGLFCSTGVWDANAEYMVRDMGVPVSRLIVFREDVYRYLRGHGFSEDAAWYEAEMIGRGKHHHTLPVTSEMRTAEDRWVLDRLKQVRYLFPRAHVVEHLIFSMRAGRLDRNYPESKRD